MQAYGYGQCGVSIFELTTTSPKRKFFHRLCWRPMLGTGYMPMGMASAGSLFLNSTQLVQKENSFILCWRPMLGIGYMLLFHLLYFRIAQRSSLIMPISLQHQIYHRWSRQSSFLFYFLRRLYTRTSPDGQYQNQIDCILCSQDGEAP